MDERDIIEDILDEFDFTKAHLVMQYLDWRWASSPEDVPTVGEMRKVARSLMRSCIDHDSFTTATGGFWVQKRTIDGDPFYRLMFVVTEWNNYD